MNYQPTVGSVRAKLKRDGALFASDEVRVVMSWADGLERVLRTAMVLLMNEHPELVERIEALVTPEPGGASE